MPKKTGSARVAAPRRFAGCARGALLLGLAAAACTGAEEGPHRPNVLFVIVDDLRPTLGCYGDPVAVTPNIDAIAAEGMLFGRAYCQQAVCGPSRASVLTGCRPDTTGVKDLNTDFRDALPDVVTLPQLFKQAGYSTRAFGKVHHGGGRLDDLPSWSAPPWWPEGWRHYHTERGRAIADDLVRRIAAAGRVEQPRGLAAEAPDVPDDILVDGMIANEAIRVLGELEQPFFLAVGFKKPHMPFVAPRRYWELIPEDAIRLAPGRSLPEGAPPCADSRSGEARSYVDVPDEGPIDDETALRMIRGYYACVSHVDAMVGRLVAALKAKGVWDDTIVVIWGDHGFHLGELGLFGKHTNYEEATRAPLIVRAPGVTFAGRRSDKLVELVDLYPTLAELAGLDLPEHLEGTSLVPLFTDPDRAWKQGAYSLFPRPVPGSGSLAGKRAVGRSVRTDRYRFTAWRLQGEIHATELYDYEAYPTTPVNLAHDPEYAEVARRMRRILDEGWSAWRPPAPGAGG